MSQQMRALLIGMLGPVLQAAGVLWDLLDHGVLNAGGLHALTFTHIISGPAHLMMATGFALSIVCIPIALLVATADEDELELPAEETQADEPYWLRMHAEARK